MPDVTGYRAKMGVIIPSTNTVVEHDYNVLRPHGITFHFGRMFIEDAAADDDAAFERLIAQIRATTEDAVRSVVTAEVDHLVMGMSAETFWGGFAGNQAFTQRVSDIAGGMAVTTGADACGVACEAFGVRRIAVVTPYQPVGDAQVRGFFGEIGLDILKLEGLKCASATAIAAVPEDRLRRTLQELDSPDVEAIIQVGTNLSMLRLADEAERWLGKPVLSINAVTLWHALRSNGFNDRVEGAGRILRDF